MLTWLTRAGMGRRVPTRVVAELSTLQDMEQAQAFVRSAGVEVLEAHTRRSATTNPVVIAPPVSPDELEYFTPQVVLPTVECPEIIPFGTVLINCLLPKIDGPSNAETVFKEYQAIVLALCDRLAALPFACITGHKTLEPSNPLSLRSFRLFFSPQPEGLYQRILRKFELYQQIASREAPGSRKDAATEFQELSFCETATGERIGHSLLEDIKFAASDTTLVDLR